MFSAPQASRKAPAHHKVFGTKQIRCSLAHQDLFVRTLYYIMSAVAYIVAGIYIYSQLEPATPASPLLFRFWSLGEFIVILSLS